MEAICFMPIRRGEISVVVTVKFCSLFTDEPEKLLSKKIMQKEVIYTNSFLKGIQIQGLNNKLITGCRVKIVCNGSKC